MSQTNVEAVRELFERFGETEFARLREAVETSSSLPEAAAKMGEVGRWQLDRLHPEVEIDASALPGLPEGNRARGHQGWFEFWRAWLVPWESFEYTPKRWLDGGDRVVMEFVQRGRLAGGLEYATRISNVWTFRGDVVVRLQMFITWDEALEAAGLSK
ncbi:MAG: nuclear transport factor 2 family protein [Solirubrobacterales bacterium]